ncbi:MAG TPA: hypothetical protein VF011_13085 [Terriglobales bacterium]
MPSQIPAGQTAPDLREAIRLEEEIHSASPEALLSAASSSSLTDDLALVLLNRADLPAECLVALSKNQSVSKFRKIRMAIVEHLHTPRHVSLPMLRLLYTFDLMQVALTPVVAADIKRAAEELLLAKLETISAGEKLTLARRASGRIAAELLLANEPRVMQAALENPRLTESSVAKVLARKNTSAALVQAVCHHPKWSLSRDIRIALLRNDKTPLARALEFARWIPATLLREILQNSRLPHKTKACLLREAEQSSYTQRRPATH